MTGRQGGTYIRKKSGEPKLVSQIKHHKEGDMARNADGTPARPAGEPNRGQAEDAAGDGPKDGAAATEK